MEDTEKKEEPGKTESAAFATSPYLRLTKTRTALFTGFCALFFIIGVYRAFTRPALITAAAKEQNDTVSFQEDARIPLTLTDADKATDNTIAACALAVPLPEGTSRNEVHVENHYTNHEIRVHFSSGAAASYLERTIYADSSKVLHGDVIPDEADGMILCFTTDAVYEISSNYHQGTLCLNFTKPSDLYDHIVVIDPVGGGDTFGHRAGSLAEKDIALSVASILQERLEREYKDTSTRVYFTRTFDEDVTEEARLQLALSLSCDLFLRIGADSSTDSSLHGIRTYYNEVYFRRGFQSAAFADLLERHVAVATKKQAAPPEGIYGEDQILTALTMPAARVCVGYVSSEEDAEDLSDEGYYRKAADGIINAITEAINLCD